MQVEEGLCIIRYNVITSLTITKHPYYCVTSLIVRNIITISSISSSSSSTSSSSNSSNSSSGSSSSSSSSSSSNLVTL